jgi:hypothetical protein
MKLWYQLHAGTTAAADKAEQYKPCSPPWDKHVHVLHRSIGVTETPPIGPLFGDVELVIHRSTHHHRLEVVVYAILITTM